MAKPTETLRMLELEPEEFDSIPATLRDRIEAAPASPGKSPKRWIMIGAVSRRQVDVVRRTATMAGRIVEQRRREMTERNIETLVNLYLEGEERADVDRDLEQDNAGLRASYLLEVPTYTAADIHELIRGSQLSNPSEPASRWKRERRIFAVRADRALRFPQFQFADGNPRPVIKEVLKRLPDDMTPWQIAFWFWSGNGWLDGRSPEEALDDGDRVLNAADRQCEPAIG